MTALRPEGRVRAGRGAKQLKRGAAFLAGLPPAGGLGESCRFLGDLLAGIRLCDGGDDHRYVYSAQLSRSNAAYACRL